MKRALFGAFAVLGATTCAFAQLFTTEDLARRAIERRAIEAVNWGIPAVNTERMYSAMRSAGGEWNQIAIMPKLQN
jgi:hypothetical protein